VSEAIDHVIVLAAGRGTRAGGPKALIQVGGRPWWQVQAVRLARTRLPITWVVSERVRAEIGTAGRLSMVTADEAAPMFASVIAGLSALQSQAARGDHPKPRGVFILPVDVPAPEPQTFATLASGAADPCEGAIPCYQGKGQNGHPLYLLWSLVEEALLGRDIRPDDRLDYLTEGLLNLVGVPDPNVIANLNTPADFQRWAALNPDG